MIYNLREWCDSLRDLIQIKDSFPYLSRKLEVYFDNYEGSLIRQVCHTCNCTVLEGSGHCTNRSSPHDQPQNTVPKEEFFIPIQMKDNPDAPNVLVSK